MDLRLPVNSVLSLIHRDRVIFAPDQYTSFRSGDHLLLAVSEDNRAEVERRLRAVDRGGRLALWNGVRT